MSLSKKQNTQLYLVSWLVPSVSSHDCEVNHRRQILYTTVNSSVVMLLRNCRPSPLTNMHFQCMSFRFAFLTFLVLCGLEALNCIHNVNPNPYKKSLSLCSSRNHNVYCIAMTIDNFYAKLIL